ncbi:COMM domain-containing protein 2-like [Ornithodoros turicata]|uniref:COMM domain-containing protein 2-like n=1 Tax=Ornithodoros turicata TaxID=34597 RepID=UPI00313A22E6
MLLILDDDHKNHLKFLSTIEEAAAREFCKTAKEFLLRGVNPKVYQTAAQKLQVEVDVIQNAVEGTAHLLLQAVKLKLNEQQFKESLLLVDLPETVRDYLLQFHSENEKDLRKLLSQKDIPSLSFSDLNWRFEAEVATRCLRSHVTPIILLRFALKAQDGSIKTMFFQTDPVNLVHITETLETALQSAKSQHVRKIVKHVN